MKKGFTMIELIFVIVILGILASVAIPRLASTRQDAEISAAIANMRTLLSDLSAYYTVAGKFATSISAMSNVKVTGEQAGVSMDTMNANEEDGPSGFLEIGGEQCIKVQMRTASNTNPIDPNVAGSTAGRGCPAVVRFEKVGTSTLCEQVTSAPAMEQFITGDGGEGSGGTGPLAYCSTKSDAGYQRSVNGIAVSSSISVY